MKWHLYVTDLSAKARYGIESQAGVTSEMHTGYLFNEDEALLFFPSFNSL